ncbi:MAG: Gfo/Idh/MocA family oxidoreductase [Anaerolineae bacterium]|nr:Gfo/Idh/MocA family oxidoreductase [Anaerolineae bacterium]
MADELSAVLVGCGGISRAWLKTIVQLDDVRLVAAVDLDEDAARNRVAEFELAGTEVATDLEAVLGKLKPDIVFDCTVPTAHHPVTLTALQHGCHVLGEKPLADSLVHAREMVAAAEVAGRIYAVMQNRRYDPNIRRLKAFLDTGVLGRLTTVNSDFFIGAHFGGFRDHMAHVLLIDMAIHTFDAARFLMTTDGRPAEALAVYCKEWNPPGSWYDHDASAVAIFEMNEEIVYTYRGSWCSEGLNTTWESRWHIIGERGSVTWDGADGFQAEVVVEPGGFFSKWQAVDVPALAGPTKSGGHDGAIREFVRCVRSGAVPETVSSDNIKSLAMVFGAVASAESGAREGIVL